MKLVLEVSISHDSMTIDTWKNYKSREKTCDFIHPNIQPIGQHPPKSPVEAWYSL